MATVLPHSLFLASCVLLAITGCATVAPPPHSGFLGDYSGFTRDPDDASLLWWELTSFDWRRYNKIMVDPIVVRFHTDAEGHEVQAEAISQLTSECRQEIIDHLISDYEIVDTPDVGVLRVRAAVTNVIPTNVQLNVLSSVVAFVPLDMGGASMEVEFLDAVSGERQAAGMDTKLGIPTQVRAGFTSLGHARQACKDWAAELLDALKTNP